jgi:hypothetical protein
MNAARPGMLSTVQCIPVCFCHQSEKAGESGRNLKKKRLSALMELMKSLSEVL